MGIFLPLVWNRVLNHPCFAKWNKQNERYHDVSFEEEAHNNDSNLDYISTRKHYAWFKYIKLRSYKK